jgi:hypothetical protein
MVPSEEEESAMNRRALFARIGWMTFYTGAVDEKPIGGGSYNKEQIGSELFNFKRVGGFLYGFVKGGSRSNAFNLKRIDPRAAGAHNVEHVTVIFVAKRPERRWPESRGLVQRCHSLP